MESANDCSGTSLTGVIIPTQSKNTVVAKVVYGHLDADDDLLNGSIMKSSHVRDFGVAFALRQ